VIAVSVVGRSARPPQDDGRSDHPTANGSGALERCVGHRRDRRHTASTDGRRNRRDQTRSGTGNDRQSDRERRERKSTRRDRVIERVEQVADAERQTDSAEQPGNRTEETDHSGLDQQRPGHLAAAGTNGP